MPTSAPVVNDVLARLFAGESDPVEKLAVNQGNALLCNAMVWKTGAHPNLRVGRLVALECGHFTITKSVHRAKCSRCGEMIRAGYDYDAFRNLGGADTFSWPDDPLRALHEREEVETQRFSPI